MTSKYPEWLSAYQRVSEKQQQYLGKIHELRRSLQNKDEQLMMVAVERQRLLRGRRENPKYPKFNRMQSKVMHFGPEPFPNRPNVFHERNKLFIGPTPCPRQLPPIVKGKQLLESNLDQAGESPDKDHASIDIIAERNRIRGSGNKYFVMSTSPLPVKRAERQTLNISRVALQGNETHVEIPMFFRTPMEYITNVSSRKTVFYDKQR